jgi:hypothetical protein
MGSTVALVGSTTLYLNNGSRTTRQVYTGSGTPWTAASTTPFVIANNDTTGERWRLITPPRTPLQSGAAPFSPWLATQAYSVGNRLLSIPIQMAASSDANLSTLKEELLALLYDTLRAEGFYLQVAWASKTVIAGIESAQFQEDARFWNDEQAHHMLRGTLTLECRIGSRTAYQTATTTTITNATASSIFGSVAGDWRRIGQPLNLVLSGGTTLDAPNVPKRLFLATCHQSGRSSNLNDSLVTSSTSGGTEQGTLTFAGPSTIRSTRFRVLAYISNASSNLEVRAIVRYNFTTTGAVLYTSPWLAAGTGNVLVDLGSFNPALRYRSGGPDFAINLQPRSTTGANTTGELEYLYLLEYYTFGDLRTTYTVPNPITDTQYRINSASPGLTTVGPTPASAVEETGAGVVTQQMEVRGDLPVAIRDATLWVAWISNSAFSFSDTCSLNATYLPLYETVSGS